MTPDQRISPASPDNSPNGVKGFARLIEVITTEGGTTIHGVLLDSGVRLFFPNSQRELVTSFQTGDLFTITSYKTGEGSLPSDPNSRNVVVSRLDGLEPVAKFVIGNNYMHTSGLRMTERKA